jgi:hypothetical protein
MAKDLTLVLKVDANQFKTQMDQATRQVNDLGKEADKSSSGMVSGFAKVKGGLDNLRGGLTSLLSIMAGGSFVGFITNLIEAADATSDLSDATGLTIAEIKGLEMALASSGGKAENAAKMIVSLAKSFEDAFNGGQKAQEAFLDLGFSLQDLNRLQGDTGRLMEETIRKLANLGPGMKQTAAATEIFGKAVQGVDLDKLIKDFEEGKISAREFEDSIRKAGELSDKVSKMFKDFGNQVLKAIEPLVDHFNNMKISTEDLMSVFQVLGALLGGVIVATLGWVASAFIALGAAAVYFADVLGPMVTIIKKEVVGAFKSMWEWLKETKDYIVNAYYSALDGLTARFAGLAAAWNAIKNFDNPLAAYKKAVDESLTASEALRKSNRDQAQSLQEVADVGEIVVTAKREQTKATAQATDAWAKEKQAILAITQALRDNLAGLTEKIQMDTKLIGLTDTQKRQTEGLAEIEKKTAETRAKLENEKLTAKKQVIATIDAEIAKLAGIEEAEKKNFLAAEQKYTADKLAYDLKIQKVKDTIDIMTREYDLTQQLGNIGVESAKRIKDAEFELQTQALTPKEQQIARLLKGIEDERQAKLKSISDQIEAETRHMEIQLEQDTQLTEAQKASLEAKILANQKFKEAQITGINEVYDKEKASRQKSMEETIAYQQSFQGGWKSAYDNFINNTASAASVAKGIFGAMENAFVDGFTQMVTTGKIKFKDLINTMIKELVRLAAQQAFKWILSWATGGTSDIIGGIGKLLGFADGGYVATNGPVLVGERGPEIVSGIGGRTVIPNDQLGSALGGGGGSVNYYITAVDALSFRQMVARDPEFLYAVTEKGRQRSPMGR